MMSFKSIPDKYKKATSIKDFLHIKPIYMKYGKVHKRMSYKGCRINQSYEEAWDKIWKHYRELVELNNIRQANNLVEEFVGYEYGKIYFCYSDIAKVYYQKTLTEETNINNLKKQIKWGIILK